MFKKIISSFIIFGLLAISATLATAADMPAKKQKQTPQGLYLSPKEANDMLQADAAKILFVDVRTPEELYFVGHAKGIDKNVPLAYVNYSKLNKKGKKFASAKNKKFVEQIEAALKEKGLTKDDKIILICRSGDRSATGAKILDKAGYKNVYTVITGTEGDKDKETKKRTVNGWKNDGMPWNYKFNKDVFQYDNPFK